MNKTSSSAQSTVVIVGRPNVGKSTLFNRVIGRRRAITDPTPGVTRDPVEADCTIEGRAYHLIDTGGFKLDRGQELDDIVVHRSLDAIERASLILLVVDVTALTPEDEAFMELLRPYAARLILVVNKVDDSNRDDQVWNFYRHGFRRVVGVSAEHGRNLSELLELIAEAAATEPGTTGGEEAAAGEGGVAGGEAAAGSAVGIAGGEAAGGGAATVRRAVENELSVAILGKPNTGKSTLMNRLSGSERSIVSPVPGTTRDVIEGGFVHGGLTVRLLDTAGIRRKSRVEERLEYYSVNRAIRSIEEAAVVLLVIDSVESVTDQDKKIASLAARRGRGIILVLNKWDMLSPVPNMRVAMTDRIRFYFPALDFAPVVPISALTGDGIPSLLQTIAQVWRELNRRIDTPKLNQALKRWNDRYLPHSSSQASFRARYLTQIGILPLRFLLFVNRRKGFPSSWVEYLRNNLRKEFGMAHVPIEIELRERE